MVSHCTYRLDSGYVSPKRVYILLTIMKGKVFGAIGVIVFAFLVWFFGSDVSIDHSQEQQIGS